MTATTGAYFKDFAKTYVMVAAIVAIILFLLFTVLNVNLNNAIFRGAVIGGGIGAMMWPFQVFCRAFLENENRHTQGVEAWRFAFLFALVALGIHIVLSVVLFAAGMQIPGILPQEQVQLVGVILAMIFMLQVPIFRLFQWAAFRGIEKQLEKQGRN